MWSAAHQREGKGPRDAREGHGDIGSTVTSTPQALACCSREVHSGGRLRQAPGIAGKVGGGAGSNLLAVGITAWSEALSRCLSTRGRALTC